MSSRQLHKRHKSATTKNNNLSERLVVKFKYALFQVFLIVFICCILIYQFVVTIDLKQRRFKTPYYFIINRTYVELNFHYEFTFVNTIQQLRFVDLPERFVEQNKTKRVKNGTLARAVISYNQCSG